MKPNEIFCFPIENISIAASNNREKHNCIYLNRKCIKQSRTIDYPMGVCSVISHQIKPIICPQRFLEDNIVFNDIANDAFGTTNDIIIFSEVKIKNVGSFDFVMVKHFPLSNKIENFCIIEFQSDSTTGTGKLVNALTDFIENNSISNDYRFGLNTYNTIKLSYIQMLIKGQLMEKWNKNIYWVMQDYVFNNMVNRFHLLNLEESEINKSKYYIYDLEDVNNVNKIKLQKKLSSSINNLLTAFTKQPTPNIKTFISVLEKKIQLNIGLRISSI